MEDIARQITQILIAMKQRRWIGMAVAWLVAILGAMVVVVMHDRYEASARVFVDTQTVLKPLMNGLAFQPDSDQQVRMLARTLISRPNIERLIQSPRIGLTGLTPGARERAIDGLMKGIRVSPSGDANLFAIAYRDTDPERAQRIVEELVSMFVNSGVLDKQRDSEQARQFLDSQIKEYETKLTDSENRLKDFKLRNFGLTGTSDKDYFARVSNATDKVSQIRIQLQAAERSRDALKRELSNEEPSMPMEALGPGLVPQPSETEARLDAQKRQLDDLMRRYTDEHPDVIAVKRNIAALEKQKKIEDEAKAHNKNHLAPTSPVFQRIRIALAEAEANVASLQGQLGAEQALLDQARATAGRMPEVEAQLAQLNRDYDVVRKNYEQLVSRRESASLGEKINETTNMAEFRVVEPPRVSPTPAKPSRMMVAVLTVIAALAAGVGASFGLTQLFPTIGDTRSLKELTGRPVLGSVSLVIGPAAGAAIKRDKLYFVSAFALFLILNLVWLVLVKQVLTH